jgi:galacturan 1,4-alpha-galacturonidase
MLSVLFPLSIIASLTTQTYAAGVACEVPGGTSDDGPAIASALNSCNNGGTVSVNSLMYD